MTKREDLLTVKYELGEWLSDEALASKNYMLTTLGKIVLRVVEYVLARDEQPAPQPQRRLKDGFRESDGDVLKMVGMRKDADGFRHSYIIVGPIGSNKVKHCYEDASGGGGGVGNGEKLSVTPSPADAAPAKWRAADSGSREDDGRTDPDHFHTAPDAAAGELIYDGHKWQEMFRATQVEKKVGFLMFCLLPEDEAEGQP